MSPSNSSKPPQDEAGTQRGQTVDHDKADRAIDTHPAGSKVAMRRRRYDPDHYREVAARAHARMQDLYDSEPQRRGGTTTKQRYGHAHYVEIGTKGGEAVRDKRGHDFYVEIGRRGGKSPKQHSHESQASEDASRSEN